jgi:hypothetical protein
MSMPSQPIKSRRQAFALAAALALTVVTGGAAVTGLRHTPSPTPKAAQVVQVAPAPAAAASHEKADD